MLLWRTSPGWQRALISPRLRADPRLRVWIARAVVSLLMFIAVTMLLISVLVHGGTRAQLSELSREFGVDRHTVARWREWWCTTFVQTRFWQAKQAAFAPPVDQSRLPASMFERVLGRPLRQLVNLLRFLTPITGGAAAVRVS